MKELKGVKLQVCNSKTIGRRGRVPCLPLFFRSL